MDSNGPDLPGLVARAKAGDQAAVGELADRFWVEIRDYLRPLAGDAADDVAQQVFLELPRVLKGYEESNRFRAWLRSVAFNKYREWKRKAVTRNRLEQAAAANEGQPTDSTTTLFGSTVKRALRLMKDLLPTGQRKAWELNEQGLPPREIASRLGISAGAVSVRLFHAKTKLVALFRKHFPNLLRG